MLHILAPSRLVRLEQEVRMLEHRDTKIWLPGGLVSPEIVTVTMLPITSA